MMLAHLQHDVKYADCDDISKKMEVHVGGQAHHLIMQEPVKAVIPGRCEDLSLSTTKTLCV